MKNYMRSSDFPKELSIKIIREGEEEFKTPPTQTEAHSNSLSKQFLKNISYSEQNIQTEAHLEGARKQLQEKQIIKEEKVEPKIEKAEYTLKPSVLKNIAERLKSTCRELKNLKTEEDKKKKIIRYFWGKEYMKRKDREIYIYMNNKVFLPLSTIEKGKKESFIEGSLFLGGKEYKGYITEEKIEEFSVMSEEVEDSKIGQIDVLERSIKAFRDRINSTPIIGEYYTTKERARIQRTYQRPEEQSKYIIFLICSLKEGKTFEETVDLIKSRIEIK